jgi:hypothetical protein
MVIVSDAGLPDGIFAYRKSQFGYILEGLGVDNVGILYGHSVYVHLIYLFVHLQHIFCVHLESYTRFGRLYQEKIWQPCSDTNVDDPGLEFHLDKNNILAVWNKF